MFCAEFRYLMHHYVAFQHQEMLFGASSHTCSHRLSPTSLDLQVRQLRAIVINCYFLNSAYTLKVIIIEYSPFYFIKRVMYSIHDQSVFPVSDAVAQQHEWAFARASPLVTSLFRKVKTFHTVNDSEFLNFRISIFNISIICNLIWTIMCIYLFLFKWFYRQLTAAKYQNLFTVWKTGDLSQQSVVLLCFPWQLAVIFSAEQLLCQLQQLLEAHEVNWKHVLCFLSTLLVYNPLAQSTLKG